MSNVMQEAEQKKQKALDNAKNFMHAPQGERYLTIALIHQLEQLTYILNEIGYQVQDANRRS